MTATFTENHGQGRITTASGGTHPFDKVHDGVVEAMLEKGFDITQNKPRLITVSKPHRADYVVVIGCWEESICLATLLDRVID
ncbi:MAG: hypothetical protein ACFFBU_05665 [Promethearchaeota archaeon]